MNAFLIGGREIKEGLLRIAERVERKIESAIKERRVRAQEV
jgi:hypothetical protein